MPRKSFKLNPTDTFKIGTDQVTGIQTLSYTKEGTETLLGSDGLAYLHGAFVGDISYTVEVEFTDVSFEFSTGECLGAFELNIIQNACLDASGQTTVKYAFARGIVSNARVQTNHIGNSSGTATIRVTSADGICAPEQSTG